LEGKTKNVRLKKNAKGAKRRGRGKKGGRHRGKSGRVVTLPVP